MSIQITCINKAKGDHENPYVAISRLGWFNTHTQEKGSSTRETIYDWVNKGIKVYVKDSNGNAADLIAMISAKGTKYVKTKADNVQSDNLLKLKEC